MTPAVGRQIQATLQIIGQFATPRVELGRGKLDNWRTDAGSKRQFLLAVV